MYLLDLERQYCQTMNMKPNKITRKRSNEIMFLHTNIVTDRLMFRPYQDEDAEAIFQMTQEPDHFAYMPEEVPAELKDIHSLINWSKECNQKNTKDRIYKFNLAVFLKETGEFIGICGLGPNDLNSEEVELYYSLVKKHQGKGYAKEAASALLSYGFDTIGLQRVVGLVHPENHASLHILKSLGMTYLKEISGYVGDKEEFNGYQLYEVVKAN
jgi:[ribosomal protein S5]-alanine N-acetyltransferase